MAKRKTVKAHGPESASMRRSTLTLSEHQDLRLTVYARRHRLTRSEALQQAVSMLCAGMRIGFGTEDSEDGEAA
jgi:hypothetical protein